MLVGNRGMPRAAPVGHTAGSLQQRPSDCEHTRCIILAVIREEVMGGLDREAGAQVFASSEF